MSSAATTTKFQTLEINSRPEDQFRRSNDDFSSQKAKRIDELAAAAEEEEEEDYEGDQLQADRVLEEEYRADFSTSCCPHCFSFRSHRYTRIGKSGRSFFLSGNNDVDVQQGRIFHSWFPVLLRKTKGLLEIVYKGVDFRKRSCLRPSTGCVIPHYHHQRNHSYPVAAANYRSSSAGHDYKTKFRYDVRGYSLNFEDSSFGHGDQEGSTFPDFSTRLACRTLSNKP